jgi:large subunit ribosomal protein L18
MDKAAQKVASRARRHIRVRARISGTAARPRLAVFRSNRYVYAQLINDEAGTTVAAMDSRKVEGATTMARAGEVGKAIAAAAGKLGVTEAVFDRGGFKYQGIIAALADGARAGGLKF